jgi:phosphosulfolactate synthase (CoM biosynthesis protein A)
LERGAEQVTVDNLALPGEHAGQWREQIVRRLVDELGLSKLMFEAPDPEVL